MAASKFTPSFWSKLRECWESDSRDGFKWLVDEKKLDISAPGVRKRALLEGWKKIGMEVSELETRETKKPRNHPEKPSRETKKPSRETTRKTNSSKGLIARSKLHRPIHHADKTLCAMLIKPNVQQAVHGLASARARLSCWAASSAPQPVAFAAQPAVQVTSPLRLAVATPTVRENRPTLPPRIPAASRLRAFVLSPA